MDSAGIGAARLGHVTPAEIRRSAPTSRGKSLRPVPPGASKHKEVRYVDIREDQFDEVRLTAWIRQAAALPGWGKS